MKIAIINGPNLNMLGKREKEFYGSFTLKELETFLLNNKKSKTELLFFQSNQEGDIIGYIHNCKQNNVTGMIINLGGFTHTSVAIRDAIIAVQIPAIEVHISNVYKREKFRHFSYISDIVQGCIMGLGKYGYKLAVEYLEVT